MKIVSLSMFFAFVFMLGCTKDKAPALIDTELYEMAQETSGYTWFYNQDTLLNKSSGSGHPQSYLKTRFNSIAASSLDAAGRVLPNAIFAEGSVIVKELINTPGTVDRYAILFKNSTNEHADDNGWVWGYIDGDGTVAVSAVNKGASCISCHSQTNHIDNTLMNAYFP